MTCRKTYRYICDNLDERLDSPRCRQIRQHLEQCPNCRAYLDSIKKTVALYKLDTAPDIPASAHRRLMKVIGAEMPHMRRSPAGRSPHSGGS
jgi:RNA polymerase sigma-70 factor (ECF subfamily)